MSRTTFLTVLLLCCTIVLALSACGPGAPEPGAPPESADVVEEAAAPQQQPTELPQSTETSQPEAAPTDLPAPTEAPAAGEPAAEPDAPEAPAKPGGPYALQEPPLEGDHILEIESRLFDLGYLELGVPDGVFDRQTDAAVKHFQHLNNLPVDGVLNEAAVDVLFSEEAAWFSHMPPFPGEVLRVHLLEDHVTSFCDDERFKQRLADLGYMDENSAEFTGWRIYGPDTAEAVRLFQIANGLPANGEVDPGDWAAIFSPSAIAADGTQAVTPPGDVEWSTTIFPVLTYAFQLAYDGQRVWVLHSAGSYRNQNVILAVDPDAGLTDPRLTILPGDCDAPDQQVASMVYVENSNRLCFLFPNTVSDMWASGYVKDRPDVQSLDPETMLLYSRMPVGSCPGDYCYPSSALGTDGRRLWASANNSVWAVNPSNGATSNPRQVGFLLGGRMVYDGTCLWMAGESGAAAFHPKGGYCPGGVDAYALPAEVLAFDGQRIWGAGGGALASLDVGTGELSYGVDIGGVSALAYDGRVLWAALPGGNVIQGIDPDTGSIGEPIPVGENPVDLLFDGRRLWVLNAGSRTVQYIDPSTYEIDIIVPTAAPVQPTATPKPTRTASPTPTAPAFDRQLSLQSPNLTGDDVLLVQRRLAELGYSEVGQPDGVFGAMTDGAVRHFQEVNGLVTDGVIGPLTWEALFAPDARRP